MPIAGLDHRRRSWWFGLAKLWTTSPLFNVLCGLIIILLLCAHQMLPTGTAKTLAENAYTIHAHGTLPLFVSAIFAGGLGAHFAWTFILGNFLLAAAGNMLGGLGLVTLDRLTQGKQGERNGASA